MHYREVPVNCVYNLQSNWLLVGQLKDAFMKHYIAKKSRQMYNSIVTSAGMCVGIGGEFMAYRYEWYKSRGICPNCKCRKLQPNRSRCSYCLAADAARAKRRRDEKRRLKERGWD